MGKIDKIGTTVHIFHTNGHSNQFLHLLNAKK